MKHWYKYSPPAHQPLGTVTVSYDCEHLLFPLQTLAVWQHKETNAEPKHKLRMLPPRRWRHFCYLTNSLASCLTEGIHRILYRAPFTYGRIWGKQSDTDTHTDSIFMISGHMVTACMNMQQQRNMDKKRKECLCSGSKYHYIFYRCTVCHTSDNLS